MTANVAKIRLLPGDGFDYGDAEGDISGTLTITADGQDPVVITLTGSAGDPKLTTSTIPAATKYVPYEVQILHNNKYPWNKVKLTKTSGTLPNGIVLKDNGELYGVPKETGTFNFSVRMINSDTRFGTSTENYTLVVKANTNANVAAETDLGYEITKRIPNMTVASAQELVMNGEYGEFVDLWLNGVKLTRGVDYTAEAGSTKITVSAQTFNNKGTSGTNTIAGEYRDSEGDLKKAAQNYTQGSSGNNGDRDGSAKSNEPAKNHITVDSPEGGWLAVNPTNPKAGDVVTVTATPRAGFLLENLNIRDSKGNALPYEDKGGGIYTFVYVGGDIKLSAAFTMIPTGLPFRDIFVSDWYLEAIKFCYERGWLLGMSATDFDPEVATSRAMLVTVLHRISGAPECGPCLFADIPENTWYTKAVSWAAENEIVKGMDDEIFDPNGEITREQMAVIIYNFCVYAGVDLPKVNDSSIRDGGEISDWAMDAVMAMYQAGILNGKDDGKFDPKGTATRVEIATILQRLSDLFETPAR